MMNSYLRRQVGGTIDLELRIAEDKNAAAAATAASAAAARAEAALKAETQERLFDGRAGPLMWVDLRGGGFASMLSDDGVGALQVAGDPRLWAGIVSRCGNTQLSCLGVGHAAYWPESCKASARFEAETYPAPPRDAASAPSELCFGCRCSRCGRGGCGQRTPTAWQIPFAALLWAATLFRWIT